MNDSAPLTPSLSRAKLVEEGPTDVSVAATSAQCQSLAERFGLIALNRLSADVTVSAIEGPGVRVAGTLKAEATQPCVVTRKPVIETIDDTFALQLMPEARVAEIEEDVVMDPEAEELDVLEGDTVDVGEIIAQSLALALNPYPRIEGAELPAAARDDAGLEEDDASLNPFAALKSLKQDT